MISRICGTLVKLNGDHLTVLLNGIHYEIFIPAAIMRSIERIRKENDIVELVTYHYYHVEPSRQIPILIGFLNEIEKEFFECFITVSGIGPKAAVKALALPFSRIARAIDEGDFSLLTSLPGIGDRRAREIVAKLQGRVGKYGLIRDRDLKEEPVSLGRELEKETLAVLRKLEYSRSEAEQMIRAALKQNDKIETVEDLLNEVYRQKTRKA